MSFSAKVKEYISAVPVERDCCAFSELSALIKTAGSLSITRLGTAIEFLSENEFLPKRVDMILSRFYGVKAKTEIHNINSRKRFVVTLPTNLTDRVLMDCCLTDRESEGELIEGISNYLLMDECCLASYARGAFLGCGYVNKTKGYHLEFVCTDERFASDFGHLLAQCEIMTKKVLRKARFVVYLKSGTQICDLLALIGADKAALQMYDDITIREVGSQVNRQTNCINHNISKTAEAYVRVANALENIEKHLGMDYLKPSLKEAAALRLKFPSDSVDALAKRTGGKITKSGLMHRFNKIITLAKSIEK